LIGSVARIGKFTDDGHNSLTKSANEGAATVNIGELKLGEQREGGGAGTRARLGAEVVLDPRGEREQGNR
jgi:hypothetical protein